MLEEIKNEEMTNENNKAIDPQEYFNFVKSKKSEMTSEKLDKMHDIIMKQISKAMAIGQNLQVRRLAFTLSSLAKEYKILEVGIDTYVLREHIEEFIDNVADKATKVVELENYPREIPDEIYKTVKMLKEKKLFDNFMIVYTDYTSQTLKDIAQERKRKDPIIFGVYEKLIDGLWNINDRFYFIGDWEDEYCDLTLTKMIEKMSAKGKDIVQKVFIPKVTEEDIRSYVNKLEETEKQNRFRLGQGKPSFFKKIKNAVKELIK